MNTGNGNGYGYPYGVGQTGYGSGYGAQMADTRQYNSGYSSYQPISNRSDRGKGAGRVVASSIMSFLLVAFSLFTMMIIFISALSSTTLYYSGFLSWLLISQLFSSPILAALGCFFMLLMMLIIMLINMHRMRRAMFFIGLSFTVTAVLGMSAGAFSKSIVELFPDEWYSFFIKLTGTFSDYTTVCGIVLIVTGVLFMSLSALVAAAKGGRS